MGKATRQAFGEALAQLGEKHTEIVVLDADLAKSTKSEIFAKKFPNRFFEMGIAEANMIGTAAGLAFAGKIPFLCSFGCFLTGRYDTIRLSVSYANANVRLIGTHAGVGIGDDGHSQMGLEDITLMRALPQMGVFQPMDALETEHLMKYLVEEWKGPAYVRLTRQNLPDLFPVGQKFEPLKIMALKRFDLSAKKKVVFFATGGVVGDTFEAAKRLEAQGVSASVWNVHSLKPFDEQGVVKAIEGSDAVFTVEDHSVIGGLGSCVAEVMAGANFGGVLKQRLTKIGVQDTFGESGEPIELLEKHGLTADTICKKVLSVVL